MTRTHLKHCRVYVNGVDLSGYSRTFGPLAWMFGAESDAALTDGVKNILVGQADIQAGAINAFLDNDTAGLFANRAQGTKNLCIAIGANAAPAAGDPVFSWEFEDTGYTVEQGTGFVAANLPLGGASYASTLTYKKPWGRLLHANSAATAVNDQTGIDDTASSALGGIMVYHLFSSDDAVTLKVQHADTNDDAEFADLTGATSGSVDASAAPVSGMVALSTTETVERYLRWQIDLGSATTATFLVAFIRNTIA
jgi:hypothetical protein